MKILYVVTAWPRHKDDTITPWLVEQVSELNDSGHEVEVFAPAYKGLGGTILPTLNYYENSVWWSGPFVHRFRYFPARWEDLTHDRPAMSKVKGLAGWLKLASYIICGCFSAWRLNLLNRYDIIHIHWPLPHVLFGHAARLGWWKSKLVCTFYGAEFPLMRKSWLVRWLMTQLVWNCRCLCISTYTRNELFKLTKWIWCPDKDVIPYGRTV